MIKRSLTEKIIYIVKSANISDADANLFLSSCRGIIEIDNLKSNFPVLSFYCDWTLHPNIDRNPFLYSILGEISSGYSMGGSNGNYSVVKPLKIYELLNELIAFLNLIYEGEKVIFDNEHSIQNLLIKILENLKHRKIHFPNERNSSTDNKIDSIISKSSEKSIDADKNPIIINSIMIEEIKLNIVKFQMIMDYLTFEIRGWQKKEVIINEILEIFIELNKFGQFEFYCKDGSIKW
jgi:hypothetical protein